MLIDRDKAIEAIEAKEANEFGNYREYNVAFNDGLRSAIFALEELPSAQHKGKWVYLYDGNYKCSECGAWWTCEETPVNSGMNFCPNCGAKMEGEEE